MKCSITKQIVTDNKVIIHVVLYRPHIPVTLNGCHGLGRSVLSVTLYQKMLLWPKNVRKYCFLKHQESYLFCWLQCSPVRRLCNQSCLLLAADIWFRLHTQLQCKGFSNWILAFIDTRVEPPPAIAPPPQWAAPSFMVHVNPRSPLCDLHCRVRHQKHLERL